MAFLSSISCGRLVNAIRSVHSSTFLHENIGVVGIPLSKGQRKTGVDQGPDDLRDFGTLKALTKYGWNVTGMKRLHIESDYRIPRN